MIYHLNIGSNLGDKFNNLEMAIALIEQRLLCGVQESSYLLTEPWGFESDNSFLNVAVKVDSNLSPLEMLSVLQGIEQKMSTESHRNEDGSYKNRIIDIDIIAVDGMIIDTPELTVPHPLMHLREFVLKPMCELDPQWKHPILEKTVEELLDGLK